ncbi:MAG: DUF305 domain-containing protein [Gemmatimonadota bacterium]
MRSPFHTTRCLHRTRWAVLTILSLVVLLQPCRSSPRHPSGQRGGSTGAALSGLTKTDVRFMQGMIAHHVQALEMVELVSDRTGNEAIQRLARRIEVSQKDEIAIMERWLERRGLAVPEGLHHGPLMPGMLTGEELARLAAADGEEFDRLFLEYMIRHHEGALVMVEDLFSGGGGQEVEVFQLASHVDADQRAEIARMREMLNILIQEGNE